MSKRFTDTNKFDDPWYCNLTNDAKLAWEYILAKCDNSGVWEPNFRIANAYLSGSSSWDDIRKEFGDRIVILPNGKWWAWKFIGFQYGELSESCKPHMNIIRLLKQHGIYDVYQHHILTREPISFNPSKKEDTLSKGYPKGINTLEEEDKEKDKERDKEKEIGSDFDSIGDDLEFEPVPSPPPKPRKKPDPQVEISASLNTPEFVTAWTEFIAHRKEIKKPMTPMAMKKQMNALESLGPARAIAAINHSIRNGWQGIFEPDSASPPVKTVQTPESKASDDRFKMPVTILPSGVKIGGW